MFGELFGAIVDQAPTVAGALVVGALAAKAGRSNRTGPLPLQKVGSPFAAVATAGLIEGVKSAATGEPFDAALVAKAGGELGGTAVLVHTLAKNGLQFLGSIRELRRERSRRETRR